MKALRVQFSGVEKRDKGGEASTILPQENSAPGRAQMDSGDEYNAIFAATIAAAAYAIAAEEEKQKASPVQLPSKRGESMRKPTGGSKISRWFSAKERAEDADEGPANVSVRRPLKPEQRKPGGTGSDQKVPLPLPPKMHDSSVGAKKAPGSSRKSPEKKGSKRFEQEQAVQRVPTAVRPATSYQSRRNDDGAAGVTAIAGTQSKADAWEKERLARVREEYEKMMETIAEWETEKKVALDRKRAKQLAEYNQEMTRINKIAGGARSMAGERKYEDEKKIREKAKKIRSTGKSPRGCCF